MKKYLGQSCVNRFALGILGSLVAITTSQATLLISDLGTPGTTTYDSSKLTGNVTDYQGFSTPSGSGNYGEITSFSIVLYNNGNPGGTFSVYLNSAANNTSRLGLIGSIASVSGLLGTTGTDHIITLSSTLNYQLQYGTTYYLEFDVPAYARIDGYDTSSYTSGGDGTIGYAYNNGTLKSPFSTAFEIEVAPEVPYTGACMGFGVLALAGVSYLRQKKAAPQA